MYRVFTLGLSMRSPMINKPLIVTTALTLFLSGCSTPPSGSQNNQPFTEPQAVTPVDMPTISATGNEAVTPAPVVLAIRPDAPDTYVVKRGDTLWDISTLFLRDAWLWPEIWYFNPQINNPHLIFPGDVLNFVYVDGQPRLQLAQGSRDADGNPIISNRSVDGTRLSPQIRATSLDEAIPTISLDAIGPFLNKPNVVTAEQLRKAPYVISSLDQHLATAVGDTIFIKNLPPAEASARYQIYRPGDALRSPGKRKILGYETVMVSEARLTEAGQGDIPSSLQIVRSERETLNGDRVLPPSTRTLNYNFIPKAPAQPVQGNIISLIDAISQSGKNQIVVIDQGQRKLDIGDVLTINQRGDVVRDPISGDEVTLPVVRAGTVMIFRTFEEVSYGLIMTASRSIKVFDTVSNPTPVVDIIAR